MLLGIIGRGAWGNVYARTLDRMRVRYWQVGSDWLDRSKGLKADGYIIASSALTHYDLALRLLEDRKPTLIEKPVCFTAKEGKALLKAGKGIVFAGHTRLYDPVWREFKKTLGPITSIHASMGRSECKLSHEWDCGSHLSAMCFDVMFDPRKATIDTSDRHAPLLFNVDGKVFTDVKSRPTPIEVLIAEFITAIEIGKPDNSGLKLGVRVVEFLEEKYGNPFRC